MMTEAEKLLCDLLAHHGNWCGCGGIPEVATRALTYLRGIEVKTLPPTQPPLRESTPKEA